MKQNQTRRLSLAAMLLIITSLVYAPALRGGFLWDDDAYISQNAQLKNLTGLHDMWLKPGSAQQYYPLTFTVFWVEYHLWGLSPVGYHLVNVALHVANALLLGVILTGLGIPGAWIAVWLFALHPVHAESVAWMTELKNVLSTFFYLWTAFFILQMTRVKQQRALHYGLALCMFLGALLSKSVTVTFPVSFLLISLWITGTLDRRKLFEMLPFLMCGLTIGLFTLYYEHHFVGAQGFHYDFTIAQRLIISGRAFWFYLGKMLHPSPIVFIYPRWSPDISSVFLYLYPISAAACLGFLAYGRKWWGKLPFACILFFVISLTPTLGLTSFYFMRYSFVADHFQYLPSLGIVTLAGWLIARALEGLQVPESSPMGIFVIAMMLLDLGMITFRETKKYGDSVQLWEETLRHNPNAAIAYHNLGIALSERRDWGGAIAHLRTAELMDPTYVQTHLALAFFAVQAQRWDDARSEYQDAIRLGVHDPQILADLAALPQKPASPTSR